MPRNYVTKRFEHMHRKLDTFAEGRAEDVRSGYQVYLITPVDGLTPASRVPVQAVFDPNPPPMQLRAWGIQNPLNGVVYIRVAHLQSLLAYDNGHLRPGYKLEVRGRMYSDIEGFEGDGEIAFVLKDRLEFGHGRNKL